MPRMIKFYGEYEKSYPVATEQELLDFANRLRAAGNADFLDALIPSRKGHETKCLIATALNFHGSVVSTNRSYADGSYVWGMRPAENFRLRNRDKIIADIEAGNEQVRALAKAAKLTVIGENGPSGAMFPYYPERLYIKLPKHIGNAAHAFDKGLAFQEYATRR